MRLVRITLGRLLVLQPPELLFRPLEQVLLGALRLLRLCLSLWSDVSVGGGI